jgi:hypothetical protein
MVESKRRRRLGKHRDDGSRRATVTKIFSRCGSYGEFIIRK